MESFLFYIGKVAIAAGAFYLAFLILFQNQKHFGFNRIYLPVSMILSFLIPLITFTSIQYVEPVQIDYNNITYIDNLPAGTVAETGFTLMWYHYLFGIYILGVAGFFFHLLLGHLKAFQIVRKSRIQKIFESIVNITKKDVHPFSFFNKIVLSEKTLDSKNLEMIVSHEKIHVEEKHTLDILFTEIMFLFQWFNPFAWLLKDAIQNNLEYKTDHQVTQKFNAQEYQLAMVGLADKEGVAPFLTALNGSQLKNRIIMMKKKSKNRYSLLKQLVVLPLLAILVMGLSSKETKTEYAKDEYLTTKHLKEISPNTIDEDFKSKIFKDGLIILQDYGEDAPLIFLNGEKVVEKVILNEFDVKSIDVISGEHAVESYGNVGKNGVILFNTEKEFEWPDPVIDLVINIDGKIIPSNNPQLKKYDTSKGFDSGDIIDALGIDGDKVESTALAFEIESATLFILTSDYVPGTNPEFEKKVGEFVTENSLSTPTKTIYAIDGELKTDEEIKNLDNYSFESAAVLSGKTATDKYGEAVKDASVVDLTTGEPKFTLSLPADKTIPEKNSTQKDILNNSTETVYTENQRVSSELNVKGKVSNENDKPLSGVAVTIKGKTVGTVTYTDGNFMLSIENEDETLIFTKPGYKSKEMKVKAAETVNVQLIEDKNQKSDSVKVIGYGRLSGNDSQLRFRNTESNGKPLIVFDGEIIDDINLISPDEISSVTILKDTSATSLYGEEAQNGVIIITSKKSGIKSIEEIQGNPMLIVDGKKFKSMEEANIKPEDIQYMTILKNETAVRIYGKEAKDGAIIIATTDNKTKDVEQFNAEQFIVKPQDLNKNSQIMIRGKGSLFGDNPLVVVDGKKYKSLEKAGIKPEEVDNITVLKDESAKNAYGRKGRNGVVVIETKNTKEQAITSSIELRKFIAEKIRYPKEAMEKGMQGTVFFQAKLGKSNEVVSIHKYNQEDIISLDEIVVIGKKTSENQNPNRENINLLIEEANRVFHQIPEVNIPQYKNKAIGIAIKFILE